MSSGDPSAMPFLRSALQAWQNGIITEETAIDAIGNESECKRAARGVS